MLCTTKRLHSEAGDKGISHTVLTNYGMRCSNMVNVFVANVVERIAVVDSSTEHNQPS